LTYFLQRQVFEHASSPTPVEPAGDRGNALIVLEQLIQQISARRRDAVAPAISPRHRDLAHDARDPLERQVQESLSLRTIAKDSSKRPNAHLCRVFRRVTGRTLHRYRHDLRVRTSLERVVESRSTLTDVAIELGFSSHSHFTQAFRVEFGQRPSQFRQRHDEARRASQRLNEQG
jgi:AraC-like DNA-binding protein